MIVTSLGRSRNTGNVSLASRIGTLVLFTAEHVVWEVSIVLVVEVSFACDFLKVSSLVVLATLGWAGRSASIDTGLSAQYNRGARRRGRWRRRGRGWWWSLAARGKIHRSTNGGTRSRHGHWHGHRCRTSTRGSAWWRHGCHTAVLHTGRCAHLRTWTWTNSGLRFGGGDYKRRRCFTWLCRWRSCEENKGKEKKKINSSNNKNSISKFPEGLH